MKKYVIVAESGSDISKELAERYGIFIVPMHVTFGSETKDDGTFPVTDISEYYDKTGSIPKTSGCNPEDFIKIFDKIFAMYPDCHIIYMAYSAVTTCSYQSAMVAAENYDNILLIDTKNVTIGQCAITIRLAQQIEENPDWTIKEVEEAAYKIIKSLRMCFIPYNLDYLRAGGRVSNATALCGNILSIHPKIELIDGYLKATKKYRGKMDKVVPRLVADFVTNDLERDEIWMGCTHGFSQELQADIVSASHDIGFKTVNWLYAGGVITTHGGPNAFVIAGFVNGSKE